MIKADEGKLMMKGDIPTIMAEFTALIKAIHNEFGSEMLATAIVLAITSEDTATRVDMSSLNELLRKLEEEE